MFDLDLADHLVRPHRGAVDRLLRPRGLRLRGRHPAARPRQERGRAPRHGHHHRPGLGRQRGVAAHRGRRDVRGVPRVVRHAVQRLLPAAAAHPRRAHRARGGLRVPRQAGRRGLARRAGTGRSSSARSSRRCCGAWPSPTSSRACRWSRGQRQRRTPAASSRCSTRTPCSAAGHAAACSPPTAPSSSRSRPRATIRDRANTLAPRLGLATAVAAVLFLGWTQLDAGQDAHLDHRRAGGRGAARGLWPPTGRS